MKKILKWLGISVLAIVFIAFIAGWIASEPMPKGEAGPAAEALAQKMWEATNQAAWDTTHYVSWDFGGRHQFVWDRQRNLVQVSWPSFKVLLNTQNQEGIVWENTSLLSGEDAQKNLEKAWAIFCNDSFWLNAPGKIFDPGTSRELVSFKDGREGLMIHYSSGGVTPGDSYLWFLDENGVPKEWKMWVGIIPIGGLKASWEGWQTLSSGGKVSTKHDMGIYTLIISDIKTGNDWQDVGLSTDPFAPLFNKN